MYELYEYLSDERICLAYLGVINDDITDKFIALSEFYLKNSTNLAKINNKASFLIAECFQNTIRHREKQAHIDTHKDYFQINAWDGGVVLLSCNLVQEKHVEDLRKKITYINSLSTEELKQLHDEVLRSDGFTATGGAGLGLIDMARKSGRPLRYNFSSVETGLSQFFIALEILNHLDTLNVPKISLYLKKEIDFYAELVKKNTLVLYRGEFARETLKPMMEMMEHNLVGDREVSASDKRKLITLIEVLQNISKHGKHVNSVRPGIFSISLVGTDFVVESGNFIEYADMWALKKSLEMVKSMEMEEIVAMYKKRLISTDISDEGNSGLGLLEIARNSGNNFSWEFTETPANGLFFSMKINLQ